MDYFTGDELTRGRWESPPSAVRESLLSLVDAVLNPWRELVGPLRISSGWRTEEENARIPGSAKGSQHVTGEAVDVVPLACDLNRAFTLLFGLPFDQAILYPSDGHIHVSHRGSLPEGRKNRGQLLRARRHDGKVTYERI